MGGAFAFKQTISYPMPKYFANRNSAGVQTFLVCRKTNP